MNDLTRWAVAAVLTCTTGFASAAGFSGLYIFGDSLSDSGNAAALVGSNPGQVITGNGYIPSQPYASGQFTNGNVWAKSFATGIGLSANPAFAAGGGSDYAIGGARVATGNGSLQFQLGAFLTLNGPGVPGSALYVIEGGGNDARDALAAAATSPTPSVTIAQAAAAYASSIGQLVDQLQASGAQRIVVWDVPNLALAPAVTAQGAGASFLAGQISVAMNTALSTRLAPEVGVSIFDVYALQSSFAAAPAAFGLTNVTDACGAVAGCDPSKYLYWDGIHPTSGGHALLAQAMLAAVPEPAADAMLLAGLALVAGFVRRRRG